MSNLNLFRKSLQEALNKLASKEFVSSNGLLISGWNEQYKDGGINIFETTFVDMLVHELSQEEKSIIGWEVNYPWNSDGKLWYRSKLDFAIGLINPGNTLKDNKSQALFETAVEVKNFLFIRGKGTFRKIRTKLGIERRSRCLQPNIYSPESIWFVR